MSLPEKMRAARYYGPEDVRVEEMPVPVPGPGEVVVRVRACGICGSDVMDWYLKPRAPLVPGHEPAGEVAAVGPGVEKFRPGDRVFVHHHVPCFACHYCRRGHHTLCPTFHQTRIEPGGFAEYVRVPATHVEKDLWKLPEGLTYEEATLVEPLACALRAWGRLRVFPDDTAAIIGCGISGLLLMMAGRLHPVGRIFGVDPLESRRRAAREAGAADAFPPEEAPRALRARNGGRGADLVLVAAGNLAAVELAFDLVEPGGTVLLYAPTPPEAELKVRPNRLFFQEVTVVASYSATPLETGPALGLIAAGRIPAGRLLTHRLPLDRAAEGLRLVRQATESLKVVILPDQG